MPREGGTSSNHMPFSFRSALQYRTFADYWIIRFRG
jgi:hypothetical protein